MNSLLQVQKEFPIFPKGGVYLDTAASAQKPRCVIEAMTNMMTTQYANIKRGLYRLSAESTEAYHQARCAVAKFINAPSPNEIIFTHNATDALNLVACSYGKTLQKGQEAEILLTPLEHHSNIVPWQLVAKDIGATITLAQTEDPCFVSVEDIKRSLNAKTKVLAITHVSNVVGSRLPIEEIVTIAHERGVVVVVDGTQAVPHFPVDVQALGVDFYAFSGHKMYGPTGIGVLWGREEYLKTMAPVRGGGGMIEEVTVHSSTYLPPPERFEAGTPPIVEAIGLKAAISYLQSLNMETISHHNQALLSHAHNCLDNLKGIRVLKSNSEHRSGSLSFLMEGVHPHDVATFLDGKFHIAVRAGHHCAQLFMKRLKIPATVRASFGVYNTLPHITLLSQALEETYRFFHSSSSKT